MKDLLLIILVAAALGSCVDEEGIVEDCQEVCQEIIDRELDDLKREITTTLGEYCVPHSLR